MSGSDGSMKKEFAYPELAQILCKSLLENPRVLAELLGVPQLAKLARDAIQEAPSSSSDEEALRNLLGEKCVDELIKQGVEQFDTSWPGWSETPEFKEHPIVGGLSSKQVFEVYFSGFNLLARELLFLTGDAPMPREPANPGWPNDVWDAYLDASRCLMASAFLVKLAAYVSKMREKRSFHRIEKDLGDAGAAWLGQQLEKAVRNLWAVSSRAVLRVEGLEVDLIAIKGEIPRHKTVASWARGLAQNAICAADASVGMRIAFGAVQLPLRVGAIAERWLYVLQSFTLDSGLGAHGLEEIHKATGDLRIEAALVAAERRRSHWASAVESQDDSGLDRAFMERAIDQARKSRTEAGHVPLKVGAVVVKDGKELSVAYRGEQSAGEHAEFTALEKKLADVEIAGATVFTTLEPCTTRNHPKVPCAIRLIERRVKRVVIGMLDPNPKISGKGVLKLREANIAVDLFPHDLMAKIEEMNREFIRHHKNPDEPLPPDNGIGECGGHDT